MTVTNVDNPGVIAPPPLIFAGCLVAGLAINGALGWSLGLMAALRYGLGVGLVAVSLFFLISALGLFHRFRTRPEPWQPTTAIVSTGIYRFTRNPMYLGMALAYAGVAILADSPGALVLLPLVLLVVDRGVIQREERYLEAKFGAEYLAYKVRVRRWL